MIKPEFHGRSAADSVVLYRFMKRKTVQTKYDIPVRRAFRLHRFSFIYAVNDLWEDAYTCPIYAVNCTTESAIYVMELTVMR